jgi:hypothetical protein
MRLDCPYCAAKVSQRRNREGPNFCPACRKLFSMPPEHDVPPWILGVLVVLIGNWQIVLQTTV